MRRRQVLSGGALLLTVPLAGCGHPPVVLDMDVASSAAIADEMSTQIQTGSEEYSLIESAIENESATRRGRSELFDATEVVQFEGAYYEVSETRLQRSEVTIYEVLVDLDPTDQTPTQGEIRFEALPALDRRRLEPIFSNENPPGEERYDVGVAYGSAEEVGNVSVFVPERQYDIVIYNGTRHRVAVDSRTANEAKYCYVVSQVAADVQSFANQIRVEYLFELTGLSEDERAVVDEAIESGYHTDNDAFRSVVGKIRAHKGLNEDSSFGTWLLEYQDAEYLTYAEW